MPTIARPRHLPALLLALALAGCDTAGSGPSGESNIADAAAPGGSDGGSVRVGDGAGLQLNVPGFDARLRIPQFELDAGDFEIEGVRLHPGTTITGIRIDDAGSGADGAGDKAAFTFRSTAAPAALADHYARAFADRGFAVARAADGRGLTATSGDGVVSLSLAPADGGSTGAFAVRAP